MSISLDKSGLGSTGQFLKDKTYNHSVLIGGYLGGSIASYSNNVFPATEGSTAGIVRIFESINKESEKHLLQIASYCTPKPIPIPCFKEPKSL